MSVQKPGTNCTEEQYYQVAWQCKRLEASSSCTPRRAVSWTGRAVSWTGHAVSWTGAWRCGD
eukprot:3789534-Rhodomonas_salina.1